MATSKKMGCDKAFFGEECHGRRQEIRWMVTTKNLDGDDKENVWRQEIRWDATKHFLGKECHGRRQEIRWMERTKKMDGDK